MQRRRSIPHTFEERIAAAKAKWKAQIESLKPGPQMDALLEKGRQLDTAMSINQSVSSDVGSQKPGQDG